MKLTDQVVSRELAEKLKELGVKQESLCYWYDDEIKIKVEVFNLPSGKELHFADDTWTDELSACYAAFTVAELGEMLPKAYLTTQFHDGWYGYDGDGEYVTEAKTEADARAKMLIYLIENNRLENKP